MTVNLEKFVQWQLSRGFGSGNSAEIPREIVEMLAAAWEWGEEGRDARGNYEFQNNPLFWSGRYLEPVVNLWLKNQQEEHRDSPSNGVWPQDKRFAVCLSHDVDYVTFGSRMARWRQIWKLLASSLKDRKEAKYWIATLLFKIAQKGSVTTVKEGAESPPANYNDLFGPWLDLESRYGFCSTFFFFPDEISQYHPFDGKLYRYSDQITFEGQTITVSELMRELDRRGWEVGLHGTYNSHGDAEELKRQKGQVERVLQKEIVSTRQHTLRFDIRSTPKAQAQAGFKYDSTFGSNRMVGFRNGAAFPFYFYDLKTDSPIPLLEIPLNIQDVGLFTPMALDLQPQDALAWSKKLIERVEAAQGLITLLWHPHTVNQRRCPGWFWVYEELLKFIHQKNAWVAPVGAIGQWWEQKIGKP